MLIMLFSYTIIYDYFTCIATDKPYTLHNIFLLCLQKVQKMREHVLESGLLLMVFQTKYI